MTTKYKKYLLLGLSCLSTLMLMGSGLFAMTNVLNLSTAFAAALAFALNGASFIGLALAIAGSMGIGGALATAIWAYVKKRGVKWAITW